MQMLRQVGTAHDVQTDMYLTAREVDKYKVALNECTVQPCIYVNTGNKQTQNGFQNYFEPSR